MNSDTPVVCVTGGAHRIGAAIVHTFHRANFRVIVHYRRSSAAANELVAACNASRPESAVAVQTDLTKLEQLPQLAEAIVAQFGRLDVLVNNASEYYPTPLGTIQQSQWDDLIGSNLRAAFFIAQALADELTGRKGSIVNIIDSHIAKPLHQHSVYSIAKTGLQGMTLALAQDLAPHVRVNGVSPGAMLWPESLSDDTDPDTQATRQKILAKIPLGKTGEPCDIAETALFLATKATYMTGAIIRVDGGRALNL